MGTDSSQEASFDLVAGIPAGTYHFELDAVIISAVDVSFDLVLRRGGSDTVLTTFTDHYDPNGGGNFDAQPHEYDETAPAVDFAAGDKLVFRYTGNNATASMAYIPNGDGRNSKGRIPNITLPK